MVFLSRSELLFYLLDPGIHRLLGWQLEDGIKHALDASFKTVLSSFKAIKARIYRVKPVVELRELLLRHTSQVADGDLWH